MQSFCENACHVKVLANSKCVVFNFMNQTKLSVIMDHQDIAPIAFVTHTRLKLEQTYSQQWQ